MRRSMVKTASRSASPEGEQGFWPSYADMMSSFALILFFLMLLSYIQNLVTGNNLQSTKEALADSETQLTLVQTQLDETQANVEDAKAELALVLGDLEEAQLLQKEQEEKILSQTEYISAANEELTEMRNQMQTIAVLRLSILEQMRESMESVLGNRGTVTIGENGSIILSESVLFDLGSYEIKENSEAVLNKLIDVFTEFLSDEENAKYVDSIVISGHTDDIGSDIDNRALSTNRANSVLNYLLSGSNAKLSRYAEYFCAAGYGETRPVASNSTDEGRAENRRIEISMILKDETVLEIVNEYLELDLADSDVVRSAQAGSGN